MLYSFCDQKLVRIVWMNWSCSVVLMFASRRTIESVMFSN